MKGSAKLSGNSCPDPHANRSVRHRWLSDVAREWHETQFDLQASRRWSGCRRASVQVKAAEGEVFWFRTSEWDVSRHRNGCRGSVTMRGVPASPRDHRRPCRNQPVAGRPRLRREPGLDQPPDGPLRPRGRGRVRAAFTPPAPVPERDRPRRGRPDRADPRRARRRGPRRRTGHHRLAPGAPPRPGRVPSHHRPAPDPRRADHPEPK